MRLILTSVRLLRGTILLLILCASLALNVATVTSSAVFTAVSTGVGALTGASTVMGRQAAKRTAARQISQRVTARAVRGAARASMSSVGEAIPIAGAAVVAAGLAWELHDACATARDMAQLEAMLSEQDTNASSRFVCSELIAEVGAAGASSP